METAFLKTLKHPEFVAEAEKTRMILNPIPGITLHSMIVEGLSMPRRSTKTSSRSLHRRVREEPVTISDSILRSSAVSSFVAGEISRILK